MSRWIFSSMLAILVCITSSRSDAIEPSTAVTIATTIQAVFSEQPPDMAVSIALANRDTLIKTQQRLTNIEDGISSILDMVKNLPIDLEHAEIQGYNYQNAIDATAEIRGFIQEYETYLGWVESGLYFVEGDRSRDEWLLDRASDRANALQGALNRYASQPKWLAYNAWAIVTAAYGEAAIRGLAARDLGSVLHRTHLKNRRSHMDQLLTDLLDPDIPGSLRSLRNDIAHRAKDYEFAKVRTGVESPIGDTQFVAQLFAGCVTHAERCDHMIGTNCRTVEAVRRSYRHCDSEEAAHDYHNPVRIVDTVWVTSIESEAGPIIVASEEPTVPGYEERPPNRTAFGIRFRTPEQDKRLKATEARCPLFFDKDNALKFLTESASKRVGYFKAIASAWVQLGYVERVVQNARRSIQGQDISLVSFPLTTGSESSSILHAVNAIRIHVDHARVDTYEDSVENAREEMRSLLVNQSKEIKREFERAAEAAKRNKLLNYLVLGAKFYSFADDFLEADDSLTDYREAKNLYISGTLLSKRFEQLEFSNLSSELESVTVRIGEWSFEKSLKQMELVRSYDISLGETKVFHIYVKHNDPYLDPLLVEPKFEDVMPSSYRFYGTTKVDGRRTWESDSSFAN